MALLTNKSLSEFYVYDYLLSEQTDGIAMRVMYKYRHFYDVRTL